MSQPVKTNSPPVSAANEEQTLGGVAARGMLWLSVAVGIGKVAALGSMWLLGWRLTKADFAVYGLAVAVWALTGVLRDGGTGLVLIQRGKEQFSTLARPVFMISLIFNGCGALLLLVLAPRTAQFFDSPQLYPLMSIAALGMLVYSPVAVLRAKLSIDLKFKELAKIDALSAIARHVSLVFFALVLPIEHQVLCFGLTVPAAAACEAYLCWRTVRWWPALGGLSWDTFKTIFTDSRWIMLGALAIALINQGEKLVFGKLGSKEILAIYFFGWQLTGAVAAPLTSSMTAVLMPALTKIKDDVARQANAYLKAIELFAIVSSILCLGMAVVAGPTVRLLWGGKWDEAIIVVQALALALIARILAPVARAVIEAQGRWKLRGAILVCSAIGTGIAGALGALTGTLEGLLSVIFTFRVLVGLVICSIGGTVVGVSNWQLLKRIYPPVLALAPAAILSSLGTTWLAQRMNWSNITELIFCVITYGIIVTVVCTTVLRPQVTNMIDVFRKKRSAKAALPN